MGLGPSLQLKPIDNRSEIATNCPYGACKEAAKSPYKSLPPEAGHALATSVQTGHTAVSASLAMVKLKQLPQDWLRRVADLMRRVRQKRSAIAVDLAHRLQELHPEFQCIGAPLALAFPRYWSCGVMLDNYHSLAEGEMPPQFHVHIGNLKLQDVKEAFVDVAESHFPELMDKKGRCIFKRFLKHANDILNTIERGYEIGKDDVGFEVNEDDPEFPPADKKKHWFAVISNQCGGRVAGECPHVFCQYRARLPTKHEF